MSTQGLVGFVIDGNLITSYVNSDAYPDETGKHNLEWAQTADLEKVAEEVRNNLVMVDEEGFPTVEQLSQLADSGVVQVPESGAKLDWYSTLRDINGKLDSFVASGFMTKGRGGKFEFGLSSELCEWGYLVNLDTKELEVYQGKNGDTPIGRFADLAEQVEEESGRDDIVPITLIRIFPLDGANGNQIKKMLSFDNDEDD